MNRETEDFVTVSLVVVDPGDALYASFGHTMLHLQCPAYDLDYIYTYESESIDGNVMRFLKGELTMGMYAAVPDSAYGPYKASGRGVKEYTLHLSPKQKQELWRIMDRLYMMDANQPFDYYNNGCALSVARVVEQALGNDAIRYGEWAPRFDGSLRELGYACVSDANRPWNRFILMTLAGSDIDNIDIPKKRKLIIPADLAEVWQTALVNGLPLLDKEPRIIAESQTHTSSWCTPLIVGILLLLLSLIPIANYVVLVVVSIIGLVISYTLCFSSLPCTQWNWLIIPFNILPLITWHWRKYWAKPYAVVILCWCLVMAGLWISGRIIVEWAHICLALAFAITLFRHGLVHQYDAD